MFILSVIKEEQRIKLLHGKFNRNNLNWGSKYDIFEL